MPYTLHNSVLVYFPDSISERTFSLKLSLYFLIVLLSFNIFTRYCVDIFQDGTVFPSSPITHYLSLLFTIHYSKFEIRYWIFINTCSRKLPHKPLEPQPFLPRLCQVFQTLAGLFHPVSQSLLLNGLRPMLSMSFHPYIRRTDSSGRTDSPSPLHPISFWKKRQRA